MKWFFSLLLLATCFTFSAQYKLQRAGVLDAPFVSEKYFTKGIMIDQGEDLGYQIGNEKYQQDFVLTPKQKAFLDSVGYRHHELNIPFNYLLHEDDYWTQRVYRTVDLKDSANAHFTRGGFRNYTIKNSDGTLTRKPEYYTEQAFMGWVKEDLIKGYITPYADLHYHITDNDTAFLNDVLQQFDQVDHLLIKEDWYYDKATGEIKSTVIGVGFMLPGSTFENRKPLFWTYYPQMRYGATWNHVRLQLPFFTKRWAAVIEDHHYESSDIFIDEVRNNTANFNEDPFFEDDNEYCNDFEALIHIALIEEHIYHHRAKYIGQIKDTTFYGAIITGELAHGLPVGNWQLDDPVHKEITTVNFVNGTAQGQYLCKYYGNQKKEEGSLQMGKKSGPWEYYHPNGKRMSLKNYLNGWMDGDQEVYYDNGNVRLAYHYENHMIDGPFIWNNKDGSSFLSGELTKNYIDGTWIVNLPIPQIYVDIITANPQVDWGFDPSVISDNILTYTLEIEQYTDPLYCSYMTCVRILNIVFEK
ncbi:hypothetical protein [Parvicella tangerina]|uniref:Toxin-antitoxin system YwqK family antitoxin n=1 Tax=Parvicella tangerina TaxID=2829795 RepID=A0A916JNQ1_9FLAO|nr:hypothetical protein [Parvicella tangerina]CAG5083842.1 hypothetical protein CRYO30217_02307 [Parvicella tangerina]